MPSFHPQMYELATRIRGMDRRSAVDLAVSEYGLTEVAAHAAIAQFIGAKSGRVNVNDIFGRVSYESLAEALTDAFEWKPKLK